MSRSTDVTGVSGVEKLSTKYLAVGRQRDVVIAVLGREQLEILTVKTDAVEMTEVRVFVLLAAAGVEDR